MDLLLKNAYIVNHTDIVNADLYVKDGKVKLIGKDIEVNQNYDIVDCSGKYVLPGFVDMHFHCRVPGNSDREDFDTATMAASRGGTTTLVEMPISKPSPWNKEALNLRVRYAKERAVIDFGFYGAGANLELNNAIELGEAGVLGFKVFLHNTPIGREDEFKNLCITNNEELYKSLRNNSKTGLITAIHCEDDGLLKGVRDLYEKDRMSYHSQHDCRISEAESLAVLTAGIVAKVANARVHICHVASNDAVEAIRFLKTQDVMITAETCPPYLLINEDIIRKYGAQAKVNPPIKGGKNSKSLEEGLLDGTIITVASDHAPFLHYEKDNTKLEFLDLPAGMPSAEIFGPIMINEVFNNKWSMCQLSKWMSYNPSKLLGIYPKKGCLDIGSDADFIIIDPMGETIVDINKLFTKSKESCYPFAFKKYKGKILSTYVRGNKIYENDEIIACRGIGEFVPGPMFKEK